MIMGMVLPTYIYDQERLRTAKLCFQTLLKTDVRSFAFRPMLFLIIRRGKIGFNYPTLEQLGAVWNTILINDPEGVTGVDGTLCYGTTKLFTMGVEYVTWMGDDSLFHPNWLCELRSLIERHPTAKAWSPYRSSYTKVHNILKEENGDTLVSSIGYGMTFEKKEWFDSEIYKQKDWNSPYGTTMDLWHSWKRPGERWVTSKSWIEHTGRYGHHTQPEVPEWAHEFQGIG